MSRLTDVGDTIVEVLVSTAVVSLVLGGAYASSRRSLLQTQQAQERVEATKVSQQQAELLKAAGKLTTASSNGIFSPSAAGTFCISATLAVTATCTFGTAGRYTVGITRGADNRTFIILISWNKIGNDETEQLSTAYRVYP
jgi:Tfp pilus assembly protein PilV